MKTALKRLFTLLKWIGLFLFALFILSLSPLAFVYNLIRLFWKQKIGSGIDRLNNELKAVNYTLDVLGNVTLFNWIDNYKDRYSYGKVNETISWVLWQRHLEGKQTSLDKGIYQLILFFDKKHFDLWKVMLKK